jgi:hypothetical protein
MKSILTSGGSHDRDSVQASAAWLKGQIVMVNEGTIVNSDEALMKSNMVQQLANLGEATPEDLQRAVFRVLTGHRWEDVDWDREDNQAGAFLWIRTFDEFLAELAADGYVRTEQHGDKLVVVANEHDEPLDFSQVGFLNRPQ